MDDVALLTGYVDRQDQEAFAELVGRHGGWLHSAARREMGDEHLAEDVTQAVFMMLMKRARGLRRYKYLSGWLFLALGHCMRETKRRRMLQVLREKEAASMRSERVEESVWEEIAPELDAAVGKLGKEDREAVLLRFYEERPLVEVGRALGISEEAARKRVDRALGKLRGLLAKKGISGTTAGLSAVLMGNVVEKAPASLVEGVMKAIGGGNPVADGIARGAMKMMVWAKVKAAAVAVVGLVLVGGAAVLHSQGSPVATAPATTAPAAQIARADVPEDRLAKLWQQYQAIRTIHCMATEVCEVPGSKTPASHGTYEYWAEGNKFKIADLWDPAERPEAATETYWDGRQLITQIIGASTLGVTTRVDPSKPLALRPGYPVPLIPFSFLSPGGADLGKHVTLQQIKLNSTRIALRELRWVGKDGNEAEYPTGPYPNLAVAQPSSGPSTSWIDASIRVRFGGEPAYLPTDIQRILSTGELSERYEIKYMVVHTDAGDMYFPSIVKLTSCAPFAWNPAERVGVFTFTVKQIEINTPIPQETFTVDFATVKHIINLDRQVGTSRATTRSKSTESN